MSACSEREAKRLYCVFFSYSVPAGWCSDNHDRDPNPYLQIDLLTPHTITKLATQGARSNWVKNFSLSFSYDNISWFSYRVNGKIQVSLALGTKL